MSLPETTRRPKGSYVLLIRLPEDETVPTGRLGPVHFSHGYYAYTGSALGGLQPRLDRHLRTEKKLHWHIDYLLEKARIEEIVTCHTSERMECTIARSLGERFELIPGFGSSDCRCRSHLFFSPTGMTEIVLQVLNTLYLHPIPAYTRTAGC